MALHDPPPAGSVPIRLARTASSRTVPHASPRPPAGGVEGSTALRLRQIATELFAERGYAGTSLSELASRLGIRKPSLYNHIRSKDELFLELFEESLEAWKGASRPTLDAPSASAAAPPGVARGPHARSLYRHLREAVGFAVESPHAVALCRVAVSQVKGELEAKVQGLLAHHRRDYQRAVETFFDQAKAAGEVIDAPCETLALSWLTFLDGVLTHFLFGSTDRRRAYLQHLDELWDLFFRGIARESQAPPAGEEAGT